MTEMKQYLAIEPSTDAVGEIEGWYQVVFSEADWGQAEGFVKSCLLPGAELCGEITMTSAP